MTCACKIVCSCGYWARVHEAYNRPIEIEAGDTISGRLEYVGPWTGANMLFLPMSNTMTIAATPAPIEWSVMEGSEILASLKADGTLFIPEGVTAEQALLNVMRALNKCCGRSY